MADFTLMPQSPLGGYERQFASVELVEPQGLTLVSVAIPKDGETALADAVQQAYAVALPEVGSSTQSSDGTVRLLGLQRDQIWLLFVHGGDGAAGKTAGQLGPAGYYTDQSDGWAMLRVTGPGSRAALERICMLDLSADKFEVGAVARTVMEHLGTIILREDSDTFLLLSPRSSAASFLHAVETSITNVA